MEREKLKFTSEEGRDIVRGENDNFKTIQINIEGSRRWSIDYSIVVQRLSDGKFFQSDYSEGATESQDEQPYEWSDAEFNEVFKKEKTITVYE